MTNVSGKTHGRHGWDFIEHNIHQICHWIWSFPVFLTESINYQMKWCFYKYLKPSRHVHSRKLIKIKINLNFYFHTLMPQKFYEDFEGLLKTFWSITRKCENENLSFSFLSSSGIETTKVKNAGKLKIKLIDKTGVFRTHPQINDGAFCKSS